MIWFTGCTHFGHANVIKLANRPFASVEEMDEALIENWNKVVSWNDTVYHLGDVGWYHPNKQWDILKRLNGVKMFLQGNHDEERWGKDIVELTQTIAPGERRLSGRRVVLCHYPIEEWSGWWKGNLHLHCHTHAPDFVSGVRRFNVGVDACQFRPVSLDEILSHPNAERSLR